jgi:hypothetical protein
MVVIMDMESGRRLDAPAVSEVATPAYDDAVMFSGWADLPREMPRLAEVAVERHRQPDADFLARVYREQG